MQDVRRTWCVTTSKNQHYINSVSMAYLTPFHSIIRWRLAVTGLLGLMARNLNLLVAIGLVCRFPTISFAHQVVRWKIVTPSLESGLGSICPTASPSGLSFWIPKKLWT